MPDQSYADNARGDHSMSERIKLEIHDRKSGDRQTQAVSMPVEFGKFPQSASAIKLAPDRETISRIHGHIEQAADGLYYVDTSSNGSKVAGERIKNDKRRLQPGDVIEIEQYEITLLESHALALKMTKASLAPISELSLDADESCVVVNEGGAYALKPAATDDEPLALLNSNGSRLNISQPAGVKSANIRINNRTVTLPAQASPGDVIAIDNYRIEVLMRGKEKIVCGNPECHLLNDLPFEENCSWCGYYLAASGSFTRVTPP